MGGMLFVYGTLSLVASVVLYFNLFGHVPYISDTFLIISMIGGAAVATLGLVTILKMYRDENAPVGIYAEEQERG